jgi:hypothetical protein
VDGSWNAEKEWQKHLFLVCFGGGGVWVGGK